MSSTPAPAAQQVSTILFRGGVYQALAPGFTYPTSAVLEQLKARWAELLNAAHPWPDGARQPFEQMMHLLHRTDGEALEREHIRLFGPMGRCSLHETAYGDAGRLLGKATQLADISGFYLAFGLQPTPVDTHPEDHITLELEFMSVLALKEAYAVAEGWTEQLEVTREAQVKFIQDHLGTWIDAMVDKLRTCDPHPFYAALGEAVQRLTRAEVARLHVTPVAITGQLSDPEMGGETLTCPRACAREQVESA
jgi:TorA maturation chaperone TorD